MGRLRRRKRKYTWFPQIGNQAADEVDDAVCLSISLLSTPLNGALSDVTIFPILPDVPAETPVGSGIAENLSTFIGNEYFLKRIVGRFTCSCSSYVYSDTPQATQVILGAGFFIARADHPSAGGALTAGPIASGTAAERKENYGPLHLETTREPWIWRRTWTMSPGVLSAAVSGVRVWNQSSTNQGPSGNFPYNNLNGSVAEGSHIDARTARRVGQDDRLFFAVQQQVVTYCGTAGSAVYNFDDATLDVRILGALRRARNRSAF